MPADCIEVEGEVIASYKGDLHRVKVTLGGQAREVLARRGGRLNRHFVRVLSGDKVLVEISSYDLSRGRITRRLK